MLSLFPLTSIVLLSLTAYFLSPCHKILRFRQQVVANIFLLSVTNFVTVWAAVPTFS